MTQTPVAPAAARPHRAPASPAEPTGRRSAANLPSSSQTAASLRRTAGAYVALTKPRIIELLLVTTVPAMVLAAARAAALVGRRRDHARRHARRGQRERAQLLRRPRHRRGHAPHRAPPAGTARGVTRWRAGLRGRARRDRRSWRWAGVTNWLAGGLTATAIAFYVVVYTMLLKRRTSQNIVWGGAAGCMPVLIGWAAVTGSLSWAPVAAVRRRVLLDAAALLGAGHPLPRGLRRGRGADAAGRRIARSRRARDRRLLVADGRRHRSRCGRWPPAGSTVCCALARRRGAARRRAPPAVRTTQPRASTPSRCSCSTCRTATWPSCSSRSRVDTFVR